MDMKEGPVLFLGPGLFQCIFLGCVCVCGQVLQCSVLGFHCANGTLVSNFYSFEQQLAFTAYRLTGAMLLVFCCLLHLK